MSLTEILELVGVVVSSLLAVWKSVQAGSWKAAASIAFEGIDKAKLVIPNKADAKAMTSAVSSVAEGKGLGDWFHGIVQRTGFNRGA